ncbi:MAG: Uma2 family endonuclease [Anaerolineae bacterium]|nr:Uma2 family endonuclease [Anaerolineae bacterium]
MAAHERQITTISEFETFIARTENADRLFELVNGEIVEVSPGRTRYSEISHLIAFAVRLFCQEKGIPCHTSGGDGAFWIDGHTIAPDFAYKSTPMSDSYPDPVPPEWAVEVISPTDRAADIRAKREIYRQADILLWEVYPQLQKVDVYAPDHSIHELGMNDTLDGGTVLPGFKIAVKDIFPAA